MESIYTFLISIAVVFVITHSAAYYIGKAVALKEHNKNLNYLKIAMDKIKKNKEPVYKIGWGTKPTTSRPKPQSE